MGRKNKYETHVKPYLDQIPEWYKTMTEGEIANRLGVSQSSFDNYKVEHKELLDCLQSCRKELVDELKESLKKKARGFTYTETKETYMEKENADGTREKAGAIRVEKTTKYAQPDTGAIHLLLKNLDDTWRNDDRETMNLKREKLELDKQKAESENW